MTFPCLAHSLHCNSLLCGTKHCVSGCLLSAQSRAGEKHKHRTLRCSITLCPVKEGFPGRAGFGSCAERCKLQVGKAWLQAQQPREALLGGISLGFHQPHTSELRPAGSLRAPGAAFVPAARGKWRGICSFFTSEVAALHIGVLHELGCMLKWLHVKWVSSCL